MQFLGSERATLETFLPGLDAALVAVPLADLERPGNPGLALFRQTRGAALVIPREHGGLGATPLETVRVQRAVGSRSPSLAIATAMHHFSTATLCEYAVFGVGTDLLRMIAGQSLLVASGFAEGRSGTSILAPSMTARRSGDGFVISGSKKPCSLSRSMDLLTASVLVSGEGGPRRAVVLVPGDAPGIERKPFWGSFVLAGAESDEVVLDGVHVPESFVFYPDTEARLDQVEAAGFLWFQLLVSAAYLGVASTLVERTIAAGKASAAERTGLAIEIEGAMSAVEGMARWMETGERGEALLARALFVRFAVQQALERATARAAELLGGIAFVGSPDVAYLLAAARALAFHPPSRSSASSGLAAYLDGAPLQIA